MAVLFLAACSSPRWPPRFPPYATAPALFYVACLMLRELVELDWEDLTEVVPACVTALLMPFTYSIATGVSCGFITYAALKLLAGRARDVKPIVWVIAGRVPVQVRRDRWGSLMAGAASAEPMRSAALRGRAASLTGNPFRAEGCLHHVEDALILMRAAGSRRSALRGHDRPRADGVPVTEYANALILPCLIDTHVHYPQLQMIASYGEQLLAWLDKYTFPAELEFADQAHAERVAKLFFREILAPAPPRRRSTARSIRARWRRSSPNPSASTPGWSPARC